MSTNPDSTSPAPEERANLDPGLPDPTAGNYMADEKVRLQLAIFDVTREADGRSLGEIREMLTAAFARHGVETPPATWVESVASSAFYGEPYIVDLEAAVTADAIVPAPNEDVRERLASHRQLQQKELPPGIFPAPSEWELSPGEVTTTAQGPARRGAFRALAASAGTSRQLLAAAGLAAAVLAALVVMRVSHRPSRLHTEI
ncbi:hypothetical protein QFZ35_001860 [Arthrobacter ulcerisalmonis]|nr:hypothetical protein [Arthrobacter ulcerisalmonis]MDQ0663362.1 hypothetical protein [Arthrobacter ulcerisalmonis]